MGEKVSTGIYVYLCVFFKQKHVGKVQNKYHVEIEPLAVFSTRSQVSHGFQDGSLHEYLQALKVRKHFHNKLGLVQTSSFTCAESYSYLGRPK